MKRIHFKKESWVLKHTRNRREYKILSTCSSDPYPDCEYWSSYPKLRPKYEKNWKKKKRLFSYERRMYRTWKHNRKTQWKN